MFDMFKLVLNAVLYMFVFFFDFQKFFAVNFIYDFCVIRGDFLHFSINEFIIIITIRCNFMLFYGTGIKKKVVCKVAGDGTCCMTNVDVKNSKVVVQETLLKYIYLYDQYNPHLSLSLSLYIYIYRYIHLYLHL